MGFDYKGFKNKKTLVVFVDYTNRPSQIAIDLLKRRQLELRRSKVEVVCIQVAPVDEGDLVAWKKENKISSSSGFAFLLSITAPKPSIAFLTKIP